MSITEIHREQLQLQASKMNEKEALFSVENHAEVIIDIVFKLNSGNVSHGSTWIANFIDWIVILDETHNLNLDVINFDIDAYNLQRSKDITVSARIIKLKCENIINDINGRIKKMNDDYIEKVKSGEIVVEVMCPTCRKPMKEKHVIYTPKPILVYRCEDCNVEERRPYYGK